MIRFFPSLQERSVPTFHITTQPQKKKRQELLWIVREQYQGILYTVVQHAATKTSIEIPV